MLKATQLIGFGCGSHQRADTGAGGGGSGISSLTYTDGEHQTMLNTATIAHSSLDFGTENADRWIVVVAVGWGDGGSDPSSAQILINNDQGGTSYTTVTQETSNGLYEVIIGYKKVPTNRGAGNLVSVTYNYEKEHSNIGVYSVVVDAGATLTPRGLAGNNTTTPWTDAQTDDMVVDYGGVIIGGLYGRHDSEPTPKFTAPGETFNTNFSFEDPLYSGRYAITASASGITPIATPSQLTVTFDEPMYIFGARGFYGA